MPLGDADEKDVAWLPTAARIGRGAGRLCLANPSERHHDT
jgi:hypothetical protein